MIPAAPAIEIDAVVKHYAGVRPLRLASLAIAESERVAIAGIDGPGAEVFVNLVTGAAVPDEGEIRLFGRSTASVVDGDEWLASLDMFGIVSERAVLLEGATVAQNLALPFTLEIDPLTPETAARTRRLAAESAIQVEWLEQRAGDVPPEVRARIHLARAVALAPRLLLLEHPTAALPDRDRVPFGALVARVCEARGLTALAVTRDLEFAGQAAHRTVALQPATGQLVPARRWWGKLKF